MPAATIGRLGTMLANSQATPFNQSKLASSLGVSTPAVTRYIDLLVRRLRPWSGNTGKRLVRTPKVYVRDSGLTHALLDLARQALKPREAYLVHGGIDSWPMADGVTAIGLRELMRRLADS